MHETDDSTTTTKLPRSIACRKWRTSYLNKTLSRHGSFPNSERQATSSRAWPHRLSHQQEEGIPKGGVGNIHDYQKVCQLCELNKKPSRIKISASVWEPAQKLTRGGIYGGMCQEMIYLADSEDEGHGSPDKHSRDGKLGCCDWNQMNRVNCQQGLRTESRRTLL